MYFCLETANIQTTLQFPPPPNSFMEKTARVTFFAKSSGDWINIPQVYSAILSDAWSGKQIYSQVTEYD